MNAQLDKEHRQDHVMGQLEPFLVRVVNDQPAQHQNDIADNGNGNCPLKHHTRAHHTTAQPNPDSSGWMPSGCCCVHVSSEPPAAT